MLLVELLLDTKCTTRISKDKIFKNTLKLLKTHFSQFTTTVFKLLILHLIPRVLTLVLRCTILFSLSYFETGKENPLGFVGCHQIFHGMSLKTDWRTIKSLY